MAGSGILYHSGVNISLEYLLYLFFNKEKISHLNFPSLDAFIKKYINIYKFKIYYFYYLIKN